jgi:hypothetical protein
MNQALQVISFVLIKFGNIKMKMQKIKFISTYLTLTFLFSLQSDEITPQDVEAYLEISSNQTQAPNPNKKSLITTNAISEIRNFEVSKDGVTFTVKVDGIYLIGSGLQVGIFNPKVSGYIDCWFELNGIPIPASNSRQYASESTEVSLVTNAFLIELKSGDTFRTAFSASGPDIGIVAFTNLPNNEPDIVSFALSIFKIY